MPSSSASPGELTEETGISLPVLYSGFIPKTTGMAKKLYGLLAAARIANRAAFQ
jgi:hypothetical protein